MTRYLLVHRDWDDKSAFLKRAGFEMGNWTELRSAIRMLADSTDAFEDGRNVYGMFYRVEGTLVGPLTSLDVCLIWMRRAADDRVYFVTLKPRKSRSR